MSAKAYFFKDDRYVRYDVVTDRVDDGYPLDIGDLWPGMDQAGFGGGLDATVDWENGKVFFFKGGKYVRYDVVSDKVDPDYPLSIGDRWPGMRQAGFDNAIDAAINWGNGKVFFFKGTQYVRYDVAEDKVDDGYPLSIGDLWPGMRQAGFDAGLTTCTYVTAAGRAPSLTSDLSEEFFRLVRTVCAELKCHPARLLMVLYSESRVKASALHPNGGAAGINQLTTKRLPEVGWTEGPAAFARLSAEAQLPFVKRYFQRHIGMGLDSIGRLYQANFVPGTMHPDQGPETVLAERDGMNAGAYKDNKILDANNDGKITIGDLETTVLGLREQARWQEIESRF